MMTDNDIMKALRCCADGYCKGCSERGKAHCRESVSALAWDLICRQKEEIERLKEKPCVECVAACIRTISEKLHEDEDLAKDFEKNNQSSEWAPCPICGRAVKAEDCTDITYGFDGYRIKCECGLRFNSKLPHEIHLVKEFGIFTPKTEMAKKIVYAKMKEDWNRRRTT